MTGLEQFTRRSAAVAETARITGIDPVPTNPNMLAVAVDDRVLVTLSAAEIVKLELRVDQQWKSDTTQRVCEALVDRAVRRDALAALGRRAVSRGQLIDRLGRRDHPVEACRRIVDELTDAGWIDDTAFAESYCRQRLRRHPATTARWLTEALIERAVAPAVAMSVAQAAVAGVDPLETALAVARKKLAFLGPRVSPPKATARIAAALTRQGVEASTIATVLESVGLSPDEESP